MEREEDVLFWYRNSINLRRFHFQVPASAALPQRRLTVFALMHPVLWPDNLSFPAVFKALGITHVLTLEALYQRTFVKQLEESGIPQKVVDVQDFEAPSPEQFSEILDFFAERSSEDRIAIHCRGGNGRTGTVLAFMQMLFHTLPLEGNKKMSSFVTSFDGDVCVHPRVAEAIHEIRAQDGWGVSVETAEQIHALGQFSNSTISNGSQWAILPHGQVAHDKT